jgi:hypothetical protein
MESGSPLGFAVFLGAYPGPLGLVAFVAVKFAGYMLAGVALKKAYPGIVASAAKIAAVRTGIGLFLGVCFWFLTLKYLSSSAVFDTSPLIPYGWLVGLRIVIWALVISLFASKLEGSTSRFLSLSALGALWSCVLDVPGIALAVVSPGHIPVC